MSLRMMCTLKASRGVGLQNVGKLYSNMLRQNVCGKCNHFKHEFAAQDFYKIKCRCA